MLGLRRMLSKKMCLEPEKRNILTDPVAVKGRTTHDQGVRRESNPLVAFCFFAGSSKTSNRTLAGKLKRTCRYAEPPPHSPTHNKNVT